MNDRSSSLGRQLLRAPVALAALLLLLALVTASLAAQWLAPQNPYDPAMSKGLPGTGFGLESVKRRLYLLFARQDLVITGHDGNLYTTTLLIPQAT